MSPAENPSTGFLLSSANCFLSKSEAWLDIPGVVPAPGEALELPDITQQEKRERERERNRKGHAILGNNKNYVRTFNTRKKNFFSPLNNSIDNASSSRFVGC